MAEYIDREAFLEHMKGTNRYFDVKFDIEEFPAADVVPKSVFEQVRWERDTAVAQLREDYGVELGERKNNA